MNPELRSEDAFDRAMAILGDLRREQMFVEVSGEWVSITFTHDSTEYEFMANLWSTAVSLYNVDEDELMYQRR